MKVLQVPRPTEPTRTRAAAHAAGLSKYWTGTPCRRGHRSFRNTRTGACAMCLSVYTGKYNSESIAAMADAGIVSCAITAHPDDLAALQILADEFNAVRRAEHRARVDLSVATDRALILRTPETPPPPKPKIAEPTS